MKTVERGVSMGWALRTAAAGVALSCLGASQPKSSDSSLVRYEYRQLGMGVEARLVMYAESEDQAFAAAVDAYARLREIEWATSDYLADGALAELAARAPEPVAVPGDLVDCLQRSRRIEELSGGAFRVDAAPLTHLWREARAAGQIPSESEVDSARERLRSDALVLHAPVPSDASSANRELEGVACSSSTTEPVLDFGGIAKGYGADELLVVLKDHGIDAALVDLGSDLALGSPPPDASGWRIRAGSGDPGRSPVLELSNCGVATSGSTEQYIEAHGRRFSHIVDPRTGWASTESKVVTVIARAAADADALASACSVLSTPEAERLIEAFTAVDPETRLIVENEDSRPIFDGESLSGWTTTGGRYDGGARWTVEDGELVGRTGENGEGGLIYTESFHSAFEFEFEVKLDYPYDSGVFTNMLPPSSGLKGLQVTLDHRPGGEIAGVYADGWLEHNPEGELLFQRDRWNRVRVRQTGFDPRVQVWINDTPALDFQLAPSLEGFARHGRIGLQVHGADAEAASRSVRFRRMLLRELPVLDEGWSSEAPESAAGVRSLTEDARDAGWVDLVRRGMDGFVPRGDAEGYVVEDGLLKVPAEGGGDLATASDHGDFELSMEFNLARMGNSGLYLRGSREPGNPTYQGYEVQIIDDFNWEAGTNSTLVDYQKSGGLYAIRAPVNPKPYNAPGEWNRYEVRLQGQRLDVAMNGLIVHHLDLTQVEADPPTSDRPIEGFLGVQRYGADTVEGDWSLLVRNWFVRDLE